MWFNKTVFAVMPELPEVLTLPVLRPSLETFSIQGRSARCVSSVYGLTNRPKALDQSALRLGP